MADNIIALPHSPLEMYSPLKSETYSQSEVFPLGKLIIRGKSDDSAFLAAVKQALKHDLPQAPNTSVRLNRSDRLLWLGPDEWLLWAKDSRQWHSAIGEAIHEGSGGLHAALIDVSDYYTIIRVGGKNADAVLAHGCPLDLRKKQLPVESVAQTHYRNAPILLYRRKNGYDIQIRRSFAGYLWNYFNEVSRRL